MKTGRMNGEKVYVISCKKSCCHEEVMHPKIDT